MKSLRTLFGTSFVLIGTLTALAQSDSPGAGRPVESLLTLKLDSAFTGRTPFTARGASAGGFSVAQVGGEIALPLPPISEGNFPIISLNYRDYRLSRDAGTPLPDQLHSISGAFTLISKLSPDWTLVTSVSPGFHNAGSNFTSKGFGVGVLAIASRKFSREFGAGFGFVYDSLTKGTGRILPVATFDWQPTPDWRVTLGFPRTGVIYRLSSELELEFTAEADFGSFYVTDDPLPGGLNKPSLNRTRLEYQALRLGPALAWRASPTFSARASVGAVPLLNADYHQRQFKVKADRTAPYVSAALEWKF